MHLIAEQDALSKVLTRVSRVIMPQNNMPILGGIQLEAHDEGLTVMATNLFTTLKHTVPVQVRAPGHTVIPAGLLTELVRRIPTASLEIKTDDAGKVFIQYGPNRVTLHGFGSEMLPVIPLPSGSDNAIEIQAEVLARAAREVLFARANDETRPILQGISVTLADGRLTFAATDGSRLSRTWVDLPTYRGPACSGVVPYKFIDEAARLNPEDTVALTLTHNLAQIQTETRTLVSRLLDGEYPDYQRVIPQEYVIRGQVSVSELRGALERADLLAAREQSRSVHVVHAEGRLDISAVAAEFGHVSESVAFDSQGADMDLLFNPTYLIDALKSISGDAALLEFSGMQAPLRITDADDPAYQHIGIFLKECSSGLSRGEVGSPSRRRWTLGSQ